jgi:hypothetical protein
MTTTSRARVGPNLLDDLLVPPLDRAIALPQADRIAQRVREDLDLDVPGPHDVALDEDVAVPERLLRLAPGGREALGELGGRVHRAHALAAAAVDGLDEDGIADPGGLLGEETWVLVGAVVARDTRDTGGYDKVQIYCFTLARACLPIIMFFDSLFSRDQLESDIKEDICVPLRAHAHNRGSRRPNEHDSSVGELLREPRVLAQKAISVRAVAIRTS